MFWCVDSPFALLSLGLLNAMRNISAMVILPKNVQAKNEMLVIKFYIVSNLINAVERSNCFMCE